MTDTETQRYLDEAPASRERQYAELFDAYDRAWEPLQWERDPDAEENADRDIEESILAVGKTVGFEVTISTGGPGEWLECTCDAEDKSLVRVDFVTAWWSTPQRTVVREGSALWRLAERMNPWQYE